jgi:hypothetical protein
MGSKTTLDYALEISANNEEERLARETVTESFGHGFGFGVNLQLVVDVTQVKLDRID